MKEKLNKILNLLIAAAIISIVVLLCMKFFRTDSGIEKYQKGMELYNEKDYQNAYYNFVRVPKNSKYYYLALFRQGMCAQMLADDETQAQKYEEFSKKSENVLVSEAAFKSGLAYFRLQNATEAQKMFQKALKFSLDGDNEISNFSIAANYYLAELAKEKNPQDAVNYYIAYLKLAPDGKYSLDCARAVNDLLKNNEKITLNDDGAFYLARTFYRYGFYQNAQQWFDKTNEEESWYLKAQNYIKLGQNNEALEILQNGLVHSYKNVDDESLSKAVNSFVQLYSPDAHESWRTLSDTLSGTDFPLLDEILYNLDEKNKILKLNLRGKYAEKSLYELFFAAYDKKDYVLAKVYGNNFIEKFPQSVYAAKVLYYVGCANEHLLKKNEAIQDYNRLLVNYQDSFWAFRAFTKTRHNKSKFAKWTELGNMKIDVQPREPEFPGEELQLSKSDANLLNNLMKLEDYEIIEKIAPKNLALKSWTNFKQGNYSLSVVNARDYINSLEVKPDFQSSLYILAYPILYKDEINEHVEANNLNGFLIESIIREESYFNPRAKSSVGALGLMQLMPDTASFIANTKVNSNDLFEPEYNIYLGSKYFGNIRNSLENNNVYAVLAYNGGPGAVQGWIKKHQNGDMDDFIEKIPYDETQYYVLKIYRSFWNYINVYKPDKL